MEHPLRLLGLIAYESLRAFMRAFLTSPFFRWYYRGTRSAKLSIAPQDLRTADPTVAAEIYGGRFAFSGRAASAGGRSPFEINPPSQEWAKALYGFGWLRHLRAADSTLARANARALVEEWIDMHGSWRALAWQPEVTARRVLSWLAQSPLVLEHADYSFYRKFVASLTRQIHYLSVIRRFLRDDTARLQVTIALAQAALCLESAKLNRRSRRWLEKELGKQILADGGHVSRNPGSILQVLLDLLPLRHSYTALSLMPPHALFSSIDRMMPMVRFFRHGDGAFGLFNGMGPTPADIVATLLAYDDTRGQPPSSAPLSGYQRLQANDALVLMDCGAQPPLRYSQQGHAGCLSFEFSDGPNRMIVNCGMPWVARKAWQPLARLTGAHSTVEIDRQSQAQFSSSRLVLSLLGPIMRHGPQTVLLEAEKNSIQSIIHTSHDGYVRTYGVRHLRQLSLMASGGELAGVDEFLPNEESVSFKNVPFAIRFHLHPSVRASLVREGESIMLLLPNKRAWKFNAPGFKAKIEESLYLGGADGARRSEQIVIHANLQDTQSVRWHFVRYQGSLEEEFEKQQVEPSLPL
jgi:uncharacterized heparinase superfamily protein